MENRTTSTEIQRIPAPFGVAEVEQLRAIQYAELNAAGKQALNDISFEESFTKGPGATTTAREQAAAKFADSNATYLARFVKREDNPEVFDYLHNLLNAVSVNNMDSTKWHLGEKDADGNYTKPETSGRDMFEAAMARLTGGNLTEDDTTDHVHEDDPAADIAELEKTEKYKAAMGNLNSARTKLAKYSVMSRQTLSSNRLRRKNRDLKVEFDKAQAEYDDAYKALAVLKAAHLINSGMALSDLKPRVKADLYEEKTDFTNLEIKLLMDDDSKRGRFVKWAAKRGRLPIFSVLTGVASGYVIKSAAAGLTGVTAGLAVPVGIAAAAAIGSTKAVLAASIGNQVNLIRVIEERAKDDLERLKAYAGEHLSGDTHEEIVNNSGDMLQAAISNRIDRDRAHNRNRVLKAGAFALAGAGIGEALTVVGPLGDHQLFGGKQFFLHHPHAGGGHTPAGSGTEGSTNAGGVAKHLKPGNGGTDGSNLHHGAGANGRHFGSGNGQTPKIVDGYHTNVQVEAGHGYIKELQDLAAQKGIHLTGTQATDAFNSVHEHVHGQLFSNDHSYARPHGDIGISRPGPAHWNTAAIHQFNAWMGDHQEALN